MTSISSFEELCFHVTERSVANPRLIVGVDGVDGIGKTTLARRLSKRLGAALISLDDHLERKKDAYVPFVRCIEVRQILAAREAILIAEGVCLRAVAARCGFSIDYNVYVRRIGSSGIWYDEDACLPLKSADDLKKELREMRHLFAALSDKSATSGDSPTDFAGLHSELIDYHSEFRPFEKADLVYDIAKSD